MESLDLEDFDFGGFDSNFEDIPAPTLDPNFEPAIDLPTGKIFIAWLSNNVVI